MYSRCPRRTLLNWNYFSQGGENQLKQIRTNIISLSIKRTYLLVEAYNVVPTWKQIITSTEKIIKLVAKRTNDPQLVYSEVKDILSCLHIWYNQIFLEEPYVGVVDLPVLISFDKEIYYKDIVPVMLISPDGQITLQDFSETLFSGPEVYNDAAAQIRSWGFFRASETIPTKYSRICIQPKTITQAVVRLNKDLITQKTEPMVRQLMRGIKDGVFYRSPGLQCPGCGYLDICSF